MANSFKRKLSANVTTAFANVGGYSVPENNVATIIGLSISNTTNAGITADVVVFNTTARFHVVKSAPVPAGGSLIVVGGDQKIVLEENDAVQVKTDTATSADVIMSILETTL
jgi:hypothetical protein